MFTYRLKTLIIMFIIGLIIGIGCTLLFEGCNNGMPQPATVIVSPKEIKRQAENSAAKYQHEIAGLQEKNIQLEKELQDTKFLLIRANQKISVRASRIEKLTRPNGYPAKDLLRKTAIAGNQDSYSPRCDSLSQEVTAYMQESVTKDSLYDSEICILDSTLKVKDSIIYTMDEQQTETSRLLEQSIIQQELLAQENRQLRKQARRQKFKSTLKTIGLMVLSGFTAKFLVNH